MIVPMKRVFVVVMECDKENAARELRKLGLMHLEPVGGRGEAFEELSENKTSLEKAWFLLSDSKAAQQERAFTLDDAVAFSKSVLELSAEIASLYAAIDEKTREIDRISGWGDFDPGLLHSLAQNGIPLRLLELPVKRLAVLPGEYILLDSGKGRARVLLFADRALELSDEVAEFASSDRSLGQHQRELQSLREQLSEKQNKVAEYAGYADSLKPAIAALERELAFETLHSGMNNEGPVSWFAGWIPARDAAAIKTAAARLHWGLILDDPKEDEHPPTKIENPPAIRMVQPVFDFLGTVPGYREYDISGMFLFFFAFFFAMIFGDGGYGAILFLAGLSIFVKTRLSGKPTSDSIHLLLFMSGATVVWGTLTGTWFGIAWEQLPAFLRAITAPWIANGNPESGDNIKILCFIIGLAQLGVAHVKNFLRDWPSPRLVAQVGQIMMVGGIFFLVLNLVIDPARFPLPQWAPGSIGIGFALNFLFANFDDSKDLLRGIQASVLESLKNIVPVLLGVVNIFADVVSYIRLWAVGLAGLAISQTVNNMAGPLLGSFLLFIAGALLLVFGHGLNLVMALLSVIVHGVRLNMLEFSGHLGMEWSGYKYEPFADSVRTERG